MLSDWILPPSYYLDESDPDVVVLRRREEDTFVAAFSGQGASKEGILAAARSAVEELSFQEYKERWLRLAPARKNEQAD